MSSPPPEVTIESREGIAWITFNVPQKANALTSAMLQKVEQTLAEGAVNDAVRAVVITGAGVRAFSAGADLTSVPGDQQAHAALVRQVVTVDELLGSGQTLALTLSQHDAAAYAHNKRWLNRPLRDELAAAIKASADLHSAREVCDAKH